jgi:hypothetical protein
MRLARFTVVIAIIVSLELIGRQAMPQPGCDFMKMAQAHIAKQFPFFDPAGLKPFISDSGNLWELTYELPRGTLGGTPIITIDKRTCRVIRAEHSQ